MSMIEKMLLEDPLGIYIALLVVEAGMAAMWLARRARFWKMAMIVPVVLALAVGVTARLVVTDAEYIEAALQEIASGAEQLNYEPARRHMHAECKMPLPGRIEAGRRLILELCKRRQESEGVRAIGLSNVSTIEVAGRYVTECRTVILLKTGEHIPIRWRVVWAEEDERLQIVEIELVDPPGLLEM